MNILTQLRSLIYENRYTETLRFYRGLKLDQEILQSYTENHLSLKLKAVRYNIYTDGFGLDARFTDSGAGYEIYSPSGDGDAFEYGWSDFYDEFGNGAGWSLTEYYGGDGALEYNGRNLTGAVDYLWTR